ncbi:hypothetical protein LCGC14_3085720, partial [marine sediment metagenome]
PNDRICLSVCPYTDVCESWRQQGIQPGMVKQVAAGLDAIGATQRCFWRAGWDSLALGSLPTVPTTAEELREAMAERVAIQQEAS